jgi:hypothetical protein
MSLRFVESLSRKPCVKWKWEYVTKLENMYLRHRVSQMPAEPMTSHLQELIHFVTAEQIQSSLQGAILE